jgi:hypothetical protein
LRKTKKNSIELAAEQERGKKRYLQRVIEEKEAEELIDEYLLESPERIPPEGRKRGDNR